MLMQILIEIVVNVFRAVMLVVGLVTFVIVNDTSLGRVNRLQKKDEEIKIKFGLLVLRTAVADVHLSCFKSQLLHTN